MALLMTVPNAVATPGFPDVDSLIDDSGPLPGSVSDLQKAPTVVFATESGLACTMRQGRITHAVNCAGELPGAPRDAGPVELPGIYGKESIPVVTHGFVIAAPQSWVF